MVQPHREGSGHLRLVLGLGVPPALPPSLVTDARYIRTGDDQDQFQLNHLFRANQIPSEMVRLPALRRLRIGLDAISLRAPLGLPQPETAVLEAIDRIGELSMLEELCLWGVPLRALPTGIRKLRRLRHLEVASEWLAELPVWLSELRELETLYLGHNALRELPYSLDLLPKLKNFSLRGNRFQSVPAVLFDIPTLKRLDLSKIAVDAKDSGIKEIPSGILRLRELEELDTQDQPIEVPPPEVVSQGVEAIKNYWRQRKEAGVDYLCEAKVLVIGEPGAGKISLARKIENPAYALKPREPSTEGIEVVR